MTSRRAQAAVVFAAASLFTIVLAWPVVLHPRTMIFGAEIAGRHNDPFAAMAVFESGRIAGEWLQPLTDLPGMALAQIAGATAAYNLIVLGSFPFAALTAFLLARYCRLTVAGAAVAALVYAFTPIHLAHAAYHPHVAQTQWLPLTLLAAWALTDQPTPLRAAGLAIAMLAAGLADFYGGMITLLIVPCAIAARAWSQARPNDESRRRLIAPMAVLAAAAIAALLYLYVAAPRLWSSPGALAASAGDAARYSARWWSYFVPPVDRGIATSMAHAIWQRANAGSALVEQQTSIDPAALVLAAVAFVVATWRGWRTNRWLAALLLIASWAWLCSIGGWLHALMPMFRSFARFGVVVALMCALAAGSGVEILLQAAGARRRAARIALAVAAAWWSVSLIPAGRSARDILPTQAHRRLMDSGQSFRALDCIPATPASAMDPWLMRGQESLMAGTFADCSDPHLGDKLSALRYSNVIVRRDHGADSRRLPVAPGLMTVATFPDSALLAVSAVPPAIATIDEQGFYDAEQRGSERWRWMGASANWRVTNATSAAIDARLRVRAGAFGGTRNVRIAVDDQPAGSFSATGESAWREVGPLKLTPGEHQLTFSAGPAERPAGDRRSLSIRIFSWQWTWAGGSGS